MGEFQEEARIFRRESGWAFEVRREHSFQTGVVPVASDATAQEALDAVRKMFPDFDPASIKRGMDQP
jgi:hypothetical protein